LTAFSTASEPELNSTERFSLEPGASRFSCSATATYSSYGVTMKQVWVKSATWARTASTTLGAELPMVVTAIPEPKSMSRLPSTSSTIPPAARAANTGTVMPTPADNRRSAAFGQLERCRTGDFGDEVAASVRWRTRQQRSPATTRAARLDEKSGQ